MTDGEPKSPSIIERLKMADASSALKITPRELAHEVGKLADLRDAEGLRGMFDAYLSWEKRGMAGKESEDDTLDRTRQNFNTLAQLADNLRVAGEDGHTAMFLTLNPDQIGTTTVFVREVLGYVPPPSPSRN